MRDGLGSVLRGLDDQRANSHAIRPSSARPAAPPTAIPTTAPTLRSLPPTPEPPVAFLLLALGSAAVLDAPSAWIVDWAFCVCEEEAVERLRPLDDDLPPPPPPPRLDDLPLDDLPRLDDDLPPLALDLGEVVRCGVGELLSWSSSSSPPLLAFDVPSLAPDGAAPLPNEMVCLLPPEPLPDAEPAVKPLKGLYSNR